MAKTKKPNGVVKTVYDNVTKLEKDLTKIKAQKAILEKQEQEITEKLSIWSAKQKKLEKIFAEVEEMMIQEEVPADSEDVLSDEVIREDGGYQDE